MFRLLTKVASFVPDEQGNLTSLDPPLLQLEAGSDSLPADYGVTFFKMFATLLVLIALFILTIWCLRKLIRHKFEKGNNTQTIQIVEKRMISPKTILYLLEIEGKQILIAESQLEVRQIAIESTSITPSKTEA